MGIIINECLLKKANALKKDLISKIVFPVRMVEFAENFACFQNIEVIEKKAFSQPLILNSGDKVLLDFGDHYVGYLHFSLNSYGNKRIGDSPVRLKFSFGEFPYEILKPIEEYNGTLGNGWFQREERTVAMMPYETKLDRRYAFRYLLIERTDNADFAVEMKNLFSETVSAVNLKDALPIEIKDEKLKQIYIASLKTLKECEQDVFEDGPKRDRRLWMGDLRVQALTDYKTFQNYDLVKRCLYLLAACRTDSKMVSSCLFAETPPYIDDSTEWIFTDYCLFFISCLYDYYEDCGDIAFVKELYEVAKEQIEIAHSVYKGKAKPFIDWCPNLDKEIAFLGVYLYALRQFKKLTEVLGENVDWIEAEIQIVSDFMMTYFDRSKGLFVTSNGQISQHSQIWAVLSGILSPNESVVLISKVETLNTEYTMRTPFAVHYYLEALYNCGLKERMIEKIKDYWGKMLDCGYDCCPECFNENNDFESPYNAPEINSACHAWSCTPAYWISKYIEEENNSI